MAAKNPAWGSGAAFRRRYDLGFVELDETEAPIAQLLQALDRARFRDCGSGQQRDEKS